MKSFLKISIIVLCLSGSLLLSAQDRYALNKAIGILKHKHHSPNKEKALADLNAYANDGDVKAMHALGMLYLQGYSVETNLELGRSWFEKASSLGYSKSDYNLAMIYRRGIGVEQNFETALQHLKKVAKTDNPQALYGVGYFYYKGLGCEQDYLEAVRYFEAAAQHQHKQAMFMLGLCYRNGYGVERDIERGNAWLEKANMLGSTSAEFELGTDSPEHPLQTVKMKSSSSKKDISESQRKVKHAIKPYTNIEGTYTGALITYDWSGKYPLKESALSVTLEQSGNDILVKWVEEDATEVEAMATLTDSALVFNNAVYYKKDHFHRVNPRKWNFTQAALNYINENGQILLSGNLKLYSPESKEPGKPVYLVLQQEQKHMLDEQTPEAGILLYPNPFTDYLNVTFTLEEENNCEIYIYSISGGLVYKEKLGQLGEGIHRYQLNPEVPAGTYVVKLSYGNKSQTHTIVKEK